MDIVMYRSGDSVSFRLGDSKGPCIYKGRKRGFFRTRLELYDENNCLISQAPVPFFYPFNRNIPVKFYDRKSKLEIIEIPYQETFWKPKCYFTYNSNKFEIIGHKGLDSSVFKNDIQIGAMSAEHLTFGDRSHLYIQLNNNEELDIILTLIFINECLDSADDSDINFNWGHIGPVYRKKDPTWRPNLHSMD